MRIREEIAQKHWREAAVDELADKYLTQGYEIQRDAQIGAYPADLLVRKGDELVVFEVKSGDWSQEKTKQVQTIRNEVVHQLGGKFNLVLVSPPQEKSIEVEGIETILLDQLRQNPRELKELATTLAIENIADIVLTSVNIEKDDVRAEGLGTVSVKFWENVASDNRIDDGMTVEVFPFAFNILLDRNLHIVEVTHLKIDVSSFDE